MKNIFYLIIGLCCLAGCLAENPEIYDNSLSKKDVKMLGIRADHRTILPEPYAVIHLRPAAYGITELPSYVSEKRPSVTDPTVDTVIYYDDVKCDTFEIQEDLYPKEWIKIYDENGQEVKDGNFSTTDTNQRTVYFYAKAGDLTSEKFGVRIRPLPKTEYTEIVFPVIFHILTPSANSGINFSISSEGLQKKIDHLNDIFNRKMTKDPNGGNARITFKLALYDGKGKLLEHPGLNQVTLSQTFENQKAFENFIYEKYLWNPSDYINIWVIKVLRADTWSAPPSYTAKAPKGYLASYPPVPGLAMMPVDPATWKAADIYEGGIVINYESFFNPVVQGDRFEFATALAQYFGLLQTKINDLGTNIVDGDTDYCADTYYYSVGQALHKNNYYEGMLNAVEYFTSFNVMDEYSYKNSVSVDQVKRIRQVLEQCPPRWAYRSNWAFTGKR